jgi:hypothetical protein
LLGIVESTATKILSVFFWLKFKQKQDKFQDMLIFCLYATAIWLKIGYDCSEVLFDIILRRNYASFGFLEHIPISSTGLERIVTIYVGNLSFQATEDDLREVFAEYGKVSRVSLPTDRETGRKRGFAFVEMEDESKEDEAIAELDGAEWLGREIRVNKAKPREGNSSRGPRNSGGSFSRS